MYDFLVLPEFNESEFDLGYDNSNVVNAFPEVTDTSSQSGVNYTPFVGADMTHDMSSVTHDMTHDMSNVINTNSDMSNVTPNIGNVTNTTPNIGNVTAPSDPYYTYDAMAIDDVVFPSMMSPTMSSEGTSPTVADSLFDDGFDLLNTNVTRKMSQMSQSQMTPPLQTLHTSPLSSVDVSPIACQPTPVHSRSQSYSIYGGRDMTRDINSVTHDISSVTPNIASVTPNMTSVTNDINHVTHNSTHDINNVTRDINNVTHDMTGVTHDIDHVTPNIDHVTHDDSDSESESSSPELSLDDSPSAHGVLFKNLSSDEQTKYRKYHCPVCKKYFRRDLPRHLRIHQRVARFVCPYPRDQCSHKRGQFNRPYDYKKHLLHSHFQFDEAKLVRGFRDLKSKLTHYGTCNCGRRFRADKWLDDHVMKCLKDNSR